MNFYKLQKLAERGNIPKMEDPDAIGRDPYKKRRPGDGRGRSLVELGDEDTGASVGGSRVRGKTFPQVGSRDDYDLQRDRDLPVSDHMFLGDSSTLKDDGKAPIGEGVNDDRFEDSREKVVDIYKGKEPIGPHNMQTFKNVMQRTRNTIR